MERDEVMAVLDDPVAQELLNASIPTRLAYVAVDGTPRVVPVGAYWNGAELVVCTASVAPKVAAIRANPALAATIDTEGQPPHVLLLRGQASVEIVAGVPDEYLAASRKQVGDAAMAAFEAQVRALYDEMARITLTPTWAKVLDFDTRAPSFVMQLAEAKGWGPPP